MSRLNSLVFYLHLRNHIKLPFSYLPPLATGIIAFLVYLLTLEPDLSWSNFGGDGGELITAAVTFGIPHPPGYPTYVLIGNLFGRLPLGTIAYRFNLLSGISAAIAAGFVASIVFLLDPAIKEYPESQKWGWGRFVAAVSAGLGFAFMPLVWGQAIIAEVYTLNLAFAAAFLYFLLRNWRVSQTEQTPGRLSVVFIGLLLGLSVTTHLTSLLLLLLALLLTAPRRWLYLIGGAFIGLLPFLTPPLLVHFNSPVLWGRPNTLAGWRWLVSAQVYRPNVFGLPVSEWSARFREWGRPFLEQFAYIGLPLLLLGFFGRIKAHLRLLIGLLATACLYICYAFTYNTSDAVVLLLSVLLLLSVILGFGLHYLGRAAIILPLALLWLNLGLPEKGYYVNREPAVRPAAETLLDSAPENAILLTPGDPTIAALWYFHYVEGKRPDIIVIDGNQFQFDWYREQLGRDYPFLQHLTQDDLPGFIGTNRQSRPLCETSMVSPSYLRC